MIRTILILAFVFSCFGVFGQSDDLKSQDTIFIKYKVDKSDKTDTVVTDAVIFTPYKNILIGTTDLPGTGNQNIAYWDYGLYFVKVTKSDCQDNEVGRGGYFQDHINSILLTDSTLTVDINIAANCCHDFLCDIAVDTAGVLQLIFTGYGSYCACACCFGLTYHLAIDKKMEDISEIKAVMIGNDRKTIKQINK